MADSGTASDSNTATVENGSDPPDVPSTKVSTEKIVEGGDASNTIKKDEEENKSVDELMGVVEENKSAEGLEDGVDKKDAEELKDIQIKTSVDENANDVEKGNGDENDNGDANDNRDASDNGDENDDGDENDIGDANDNGGDKDPMTAKDGEGNKDFGEVKDFKGTEDGEDKKEVGKTVESNKIKEIVETIYLEGQKDAKETRDEADKKDGGETMEVEGEKDFKETMDLEKQKDAKEVKKGKENKDVGEKVFGEINVEEENKVFGETYAEEGKVAVEEIEHHDEGSSVKEVKAIENSVSETKEDTGVKNNLEILENVKDDVEKIDSDAKGTGQKEVVEEGNVQKDDNSVGQLKDSKNKQGVPEVNDKHSTDMGDENNSSNISKIVKDKEVKAKKKPKQNLKVEVEDVKKKVAVTEKDKNKVFISGSEEGKEDVAEDEDVHDEDDDLEMKSGSKKVPMSYKKKRFRGEKTKNKSEEKRKNEAKEKKGSVKKPNELSSPIDASSPSTISSRERPVRERKVVERLVEVIEKEPNKNVIIEKGRGTPLKDIPNVAYKVARKKPVDLKFLHQTLFGRRGKIVDFKSHILLFSGFAWHETEEKQRAKIKEKLDKCIKDDLLDLCDLFDLIVSKTNTKKEEIIVKLVDFLEAPHATSDSLHAEKDQSEKSKKRKRLTEGSSSRSSGGTSAKKSRTGRFTAEGGLKSKEKTSQDTEDEDEEEDTENGIPNEVDSPRHSESDAKENESSEASDDHDKNEEDDDENYGKGKRDMVQSPPKQSSAIRERRTGSDAKKFSSKTEAKSPVKTTPSSNKHLKVKKDDSGEKVFTRRKKKASESPKASDDEGESEDVDDLGKKNQDNKQSPKQGSSITRKRKRTGSNSKKPSSQAVVKSPVKTPPSSKQSKIEKDDTGTKVFTRKKKDADSPKKSNSKSTVNKDNSSGKKSAKGKAASGEQRKSGPSKADLRKNICEILKEVDFNTATFTDILKKLAAHYKKDLTSKKASIKQMIQEELTKMADEAEDSEDEGETEDAAKEVNPKPAARKVKA